MLMSVFVNRDNRYVSTASGSGQLAPRVHLFVCGRQLKDEVKYPGSC